MKKLLVLTVIGMLVLTGCTQSETVSREQGKEEVVEVMQEEELEVKVLSTNEHFEDHWDEMEEGYKLIVVEVAITNNSEEAYDFNPNYISMNVDSQLKSPSDKRPKDMAMLSSGYINPGDTLTGYVSFMVDEDVVDYDLYYYDFETELKLK